MINGLFPSFDRKKENMPNICNTKHNKVLESKPSLKKPSFKLEQKIIALDLSADKDEFNEINPKQCIPNDDDDDYFYDDLRISEEYSFRVSEYGSSLQVPQYS